MSSTVWRSSQRRSYGRVRARGGRPLLQGHRNRSLVLNNLANSASATDSPSPASAISEETSPDNAGSSTSWVAKRDRHMQLINSSVFDKETQARARAMEETRKQKTRHREERQRLKFMRYLQNSSSKLGRPSAPLVGDGNAHREVIIGDVRYQVMMGGSKLQKAPDDTNSAKATPKKTIVGGVTFLRNYGNTGACNDKHCKLPHVDRAGQIRKTAATNTNRLVSGATLDGKEVAAAAEDESDISSEDEYYDEIDSDDVDSDGLDEELTSPANYEEENREIYRQQDFIHF
ncbi:hypothetical protein FGG08_000799 [Glutinoglossum americanum]|uniref:C3H1-type domain-containing protein n=1 Tax=Glutinoglossum americanum TaxID=1670608 RepID=A0A9P8ICK6_9PEZI|nr:hypothetical protein FGG08_000799 [Glutinoglossum americanum]